MDNRSLEIKKESRARFIVKTALCLTTLFFMILLVLSFLKELEINSFFIAMIFMVSLIVNIIILPKKEL